MAQLPTEIVINAPVAFEAIAAIENALACLQDPYLGEDDGQRQEPAFRALSEVLKKLRLVANYHTAAPDTLRQQLIDEMTLTARLSEDTSDLITLAASAIRRAKEKRLSLPEFDALERYLETHE